MQHHCSKMLSLKNNCILFALKQTLMNGTAFLLFTPRITDSTYYSMVSWSQSAVVLELVQVLVGIRALSSHYCFVNVASATGMASIQ